MFSLGYNEKSIYIHDIIKKIKKYPCIPLEEQEQYVKDTLDICNNNIDVFDQFYNENCEIYEEVASRILKL